MLDAIAPPHATIGSFAKGKPWFMRFTVYILAFRMSRLYLRFYTSTRETTVKPVSFAILPRTHLHRIKRWLQVFLDPSQCMLDVGYGGHLKKVRKNSYFRGLRKRYLCNRHYCVDITYTHFDMRASMFRLLVLAAPLLVARPPFGHYFTPWLSKLPA